MKKKKDIGVGYYKNDKFIQQKLPGNNLSNDGIISFDGNLYSRTYQLSDVFSFNLLELDEDISYFFSEDMEGKRYLTVSLTTKGKMEAVLKSFKEVEDTLKLTPMQVQDRYALMCQMYHLGEKSSTSLVQKKKNSVQWKNGIPHKGMSFKMDRFFLDEKVGIVLSFHDLTQNSQAFRYIQNMSCDKMSSIVITPVSEGMEDYTYVVTTLLAIWTDSEDKLIKFIDEIKRLCSAENVRVVPLLKRQREGLETIIPFGVDKTNHSLSYGKGKLSDVVGMIL